MKKYNTMKITVKYKEVFTMKAKKLFLTCFAALLAVSVVALPVSAAEQPEISQESFETMTVQPRNVQKNWKDLSIYTYYKKLPTGDTSEEKLSNWYGSFATVVFENKSSQDIITFRLKDYDKNGIEQHSYTFNLAGNGGHNTVKVTPDGYYTIEAKSSKSLSGVNISTYTER